MERAEPADRADDGGSDTLRAEEESPLASHEQANGVADSAIDAPTRATGFLLGDRLSDTATFSFAIWTVCCQATVVAGGTLPHLLAFFATVSLALIIGLRLTTRRRSVGRGSPPAQSSPPAPRRMSQSGSQSQSGSKNRDFGAASRQYGLRIVAFALTGSLLAIHWLIGSGTWLWVGLCSALLFGAAAIAFDPARRPDGSHRLRKGPLDGFGLWGLVAASIAIALVAHRPDWDDAFYVNLAVAVANQLDWPLLSSDTLHRVDLPLHLELYRLHSFEVFWGAVSFLTGIPAIYVFHWLATTLGAGWLVLAHARLFRLICGRRWLFCTVVLIVVLVCAGEAHRWYGNFALYRMWQGKAFALFVFIPLVWTHAMEFALRPSARRWLLLAATQIAAVGCTASSLWAAPLAAFAATACAVRLDRRLPRTLAASVGSSVYVLAIAIAAKLALTANIPSLTASVPSQLPLQVGGPESISDFDAILTAVLGSSWLRLTALAAIPLAWTLAPRGLAQRFAAFVPLPAILLLAPFAGHWVASYLTGPATWRLLWAIPLPVLLTLVVSAPIALAMDDATDRPPGSSRLRIGWAASLAALVAFALAVPETAGPTASNGVRITTPQLKVDHPAHDLASELVARTPPGAQVIAPTEVSVWVPTFEDRRYPVKVRHYLDLQTAHLDSGDLKARRFLTQYVGGHIDAPAAASVFDAALDVYEIDGVCLRQFRGVGAARNALRESGFRLAFQRWNHQIWIREAGTGL